VSVRAAVSISRLGMAGRGRNRTVSQNDLALGCGGDCDDAFVGGVESIISSDTGGSGRGKVERTVETSIAIYAVCSVLVMGADVTARSGLWLWLGWD
jgi:hypothetical protein